MSADDRKEILRLINEWNSSRYELFAISQPNERLEFHGVMRFYFQDAGEKVSTKCIRVDSTASTEDVIKVLIEKFRPDMKLLPSCKDFAVYEIHTDTPERKLDPNERPLWVQLEWGKDGREGRFLLKNENAKTVQFDAQEHSLLTRDKKRMSKRDKKKQQKMLKEAATSASTTNGKENTVQPGTSNVAENLYKEVPDSNFTRSISNPEIVMQRRRAQKLQNKLKQIVNKDGGGTLKVYGETLKPDIPYKTLLLSNNDTAAFAVKETLEKYGLSTEDPENYCLVQVVTPSREEREKYSAQIKEYILEDSACPLAILLRHPSSSGGQVIFQIRRCTPDILAARKQKKKAEMEKQQRLQQQQQNFNMPNEAIMKMENENVSKLPCLIELTYEGFDLPSPRIIQIKSDFYEIGNDKSLAISHPINYILLDPALPGIERKHCAIKKSPDNVQILLIPYAETYVNDHLIKEPVHLVNNFTIRLGQFCMFRVENPNQMDMMMNSQQQLNNKPSNMMSNGTPTNGNLASKPPQIPPNYGVLYETGQVSEPVPQSRTPQVPSTPTNAQQPINRDGLPMQSSSSGLTQPQQNGNAAVQGSAGPKSTEPGLPGLLEFRDEDEDELLSHLCSANPNQVQFKLAPVYIMYMMLRFRLSQKYKNELTFNEKLHTVLPVLVHKMVNYIREAVDVNHSDRHVLPFWLANSSELLYFLKQDVHLSQISYDAQEALADCVQITFKYLVNIMQHQLDQVLGAFFDPSDAVEDLDESANQGNGFDEFQSMNKTSLKQVIQVLNETMSLLRGCRVNAALTIQLFSQLFHYVSMWLFNRLVSRNNIASNGISFCSRYWGEKLTRRLSGIRSWAERQGLEIAADCHLLRIIQSAAFLHAPKHDAQELSIISSNCYSLNSIQIRHLLKNYVQATNEPPLNTQLCQNLISIAQKTADEVIKQEGRMLQLEEECDLQLPFLLPDDGHSCESIKGLPKGLLDFLEGFQNMNLCWLWQNTQGPGSWKKYLIKPQPSIDNNGSLNNSNQLQSIQPSTPSANPPNMMIMQQNQPHQQQATPVSTPTAQPVNSIGASTPTTGPSHNFSSSTNMASSSSLNQKPLMSSTGALEQVDSVKPAMMNPLPLPQVVKIKLFKKNNSLGLSIVAAIGLNKATGIYVKSVVPGGAAADDGRIDAGDQLLAVDEFSLINVSQERAAELMTKSGPGSVMLTVAKEAATYNGLDAILSKSPIPQPTQQMLTASMPALNNQNGHSHVSQGSIGFSQAYQNNMPTNFTAATLPRNHQIHNQQVQQQYQQQYNNQHQQNLPPATKPGPAVAPRPISNGHQFVNNNINSQSVSKTTNGVVSPVHHPYTRQLPNEAQVRYGSERPVSMHQLQIQQQQSQQQTIRNLPNDAMPRFGSERPAMANHPMSMTPLNSLPFSQTQQQPIPKRFNDTVRQSSQPQLQRPQQISLNEMDEIDYNNKMNGNYRNQMPMQQNQQQQTIMAYKQTEYLNNGNQGVNGGLAKQQRTKSVGQLYEHIWNQNNADANGKISPSMNNGQQTVMSTQISHHNYKSTYSVEDLNMRQLDLNQGTPKLPINGNGFNYNNIPNPVGNSLTRISRPNIQQPPPQSLGQHSAMRNYENQVVNKPTVPPPAPALMSKLNMINGASGMSKTSLNPPSMFNSASKLVDYANGPATNNNVTAGNTSPDQSSKMIKHWEREQWMRQQEEEEYRLNLLRQRMDMLKELESKQYRTAEDENRLNKLRTEIEFDKRVLEMNYNTNQTELTTQMSNGSSSGNGVEFEDEYDMQRAGQMQENNLNTSNNNYVQSNDMGGFTQAELRDRLVSQMRDEIHSPQHRNKFDEMIKYDGQMAYNKTNLNGKMKNDDTDRLMEARREENRLRKHMEMNQTSPEHHQNGMATNMIARPQKHVQFMAEPTEMSGPISNQNHMVLSNTSPKFNKTPPSSSSSSSDQLDSSPSTPPPPPPPIQTQPTAKRVMFSCDTSKLLEFERQQQPLNGAHDDILPNTPCVIGANEVYVDKRLKIKQQQQHEQQMEKMVIEGEKLSFKDKMKLFARQSGELADSDNNADSNKFKVSRKQREIESKFEVK